ncbi:MAG: hypothetical protein HOY79_28855 [Streptomyces sp.]|nr:hypothetical protein [Streptomyces sp.]
MTTVPMVAFLEEAERDLASKNPPGFVAGNPCQDFRSDVSNGIEHPCRHCQPMRFLSWRLCYEGEGLPVLVDGIECVVLLPPAGGSIVQPCGGLRCDYGCVLVRSALGSDARWVELDHVAILKPWEGA